MRFSSRILFNMASRDINRKNLLEFWHFLLWDKFHRNLVIKLGYYASWTEGTRTFSVHEIYYHNSHCSILGRWLKIESQLTPKCVTIWIFLLKKCRIHKKNFWNHEDNGNEPNEGIYYLSVNFIGAKYNI